jgi:acetyltransferase-like isoleucine patch superfamily enzyme
MSDLASRFPGVHFYNPDLTEVQNNVTIGVDSRVGSLTLIQDGAVIGEGTTIGSHCNICDCRIGDRVSIQTACHITRGVVIEDDVFVGPGVITLNDRFTGEPLRGPRICRGARIGGGSLLMPGIVIGAHAIVGAGSIVTRDVLPGATVAGSPARIGFGNGTSAAGPD